MILQKKRNWCSIRSCSVVGNVATHENVGNYSILRYFERNKYKLKESVTSNVRKIMTQVLCSIPRKWNIISSKIHRKCQYFQRAIMLLNTIYLHLFNVLVKIWKNIFSKRRCGIKINVTNSNYTFEIRVYCLHKKLRV